MAKRVRTRLLSATECEVLYRLISGRIRAIQYSMADRTGDITEMFKSLKRTIGVKGRRLHRNLVEPEVD